VKVEVRGETVDAVTVIVQNSDPFTYFGSRPIRICEGAGLDTGTLGLAALRRATLLEMPTLIPRIFSGREGSVVRHRQVRGFDPVDNLTVTSVDGRPFPVEADGDFLGNFERLDYGVAPRSLAVVA
jgi:diacylglycerol kinase family enzyme